MPVTYEYIYRYIFFGCKNYGPFLPSYSRKNEQNVTENIENIMQHEIGSTSIFHSCVKELEVRTLLTFSTLMAIPMV